MVSLIKVLLLLVLIQSSKPLRKAFIQLNNNENGHEDPLLYLVQDGTYRLIPDSITAARLMGKHTPMRVDASVLKGLSAGQPIPTFKPQVNNPDEMMRIEMLRIRTLHPLPVVLSAKVLGKDLFNPSICPFRNMTLYLHRGSRWKDQQHNYFKWLDANFSFPQPPIKAFGISSLGTSLNDTLTTTEDIRMIVKPDGAIHLTFAVFLEWIGKKPFAKQAFADLQLDESTQMLTLSRRTFLEKQQDKGQKITQKNWTPFIYNSTIYYIDTIHPLHVLERTYVHDTEETAWVKTLSIHRCPSPLFVDNDRWEWGELRGGTQAVLVRGVYLAFFHSRASIQGSTWETYFMGAYTFSAHPPFKNLQISGVPIVTDTWYDGEWINNPPLDYVVYPMAYFLTVENGVDVIVMSMGRNDQEGWIVKFEVDVVFASLVPFTCHQHRNNSDDRHGEGVTT